MGVQGLWKLLESTGRPVSLESLEGKILAVDVSLWLHQAMRGMRDEQGNSTANAHLHVLFNRICKLLFYRIKPVFVFDGSVPELKRQTMVARRQRREIAAGKSKRTSEKIIKNYLQSHALRVVMGDAGEDKTVPKLKKTASAEPDMFELPSLPPAILQDSESDTDDELNLDADHLSRHQNLQDIDIDSESFQALPPEIQHEMILEMKEMQKRNSWKTINQLPKKSSDFSSYQVNKLLQKGKMTKRIDSLRKEMSQRNAGAMASLLDVESSQSHALESGRIVAEDAHHYLLVKRNSSRTDDDTEPRATTDGEINSQELESGTSRHHNSELNCGLDSEVKGHQTDAKCQRSSKFPWEDSELVTIDDRESEFDIGHKTKIAHIGEDCSLNKADFETHAASSATEIMDLGRDDCSGQMLDSDTQKSEGDSWENKILELTQDTTNKKLCSDEVAIVLDDTNKKETDSPHRTQKTGHQELDYEVPSTHTPSSQGLNHSSQANSEMYYIELMGNVNKSFPSEKKISSQNLSASPSSDAITVGGAQHLPLPEAVQEISPPANSFSVKEVNIESSDDDDFVEVADEPVIGLPHDELFPASTFTRSVDASQTPSSAFSPPTVVDTIPQDFSESRNSQGDTSMDTEAFVVDQEMRIEGNEDTNDDEDLEEINVRREKAKKEWESLNVDDVPHLQENLKTRLGMLQAERGKQDRVAASVTDLMYTESKELLRLFGVPYVESPGEAEAQCAFLDETNQTQGTITDDSDVWLFGGQTIYKNFFSKGKDVECFQSVDIEKQLVLDRTKMILLAMLLGSDYTEGIKGVGWVTAMELLAEFPGQGIQVLQAFKSWWDNTREQLMAPVESPLKAKLRKLTLLHSFPNHDIFNAYRSPNVDESTEEFSWQSPDLGLLRDFAKEKLGWTRTRADEILLPVMKKLNDTGAQAKITTFFDAVREVPNKVTSKRLRRVLRQLHNPLSADKEDEDKKKRKRRGGGGKMRDETGSAEGRKSKKTKNEQGGFDRGLKGGAKNGDIAMTTNEDSDNNEDTKSSDEEFVVPKKVKVEIDLTESQKSGLRRSQRTVEKKTDPAGAQSTMAEFEEIADAVTRKTEGSILDTKQSRKNFRIGVWDAGFVGENDVQGENLQKPLQDSLPDVSGKSRSENKQSGTVVARGRGDDGNGQRGKGKGRVGLKGKGKAARSKGVRKERWEGPKLSESSSSDSD